MNKENGFTLIELMIVIAIVSVLAAFAIPAYNNHVEGARRTDAMAVLVSFSNSMEREFTNEGTYAEADGDSDDEAVGDNATPDASVFVSEAPINGANKYYDLVINEASGSTYTLLALPKNAQADDGVIGIRSTGEKFWDRDDSDTIDAGEDCWRKSC